MTQLWGEHGSQVQGASLRGSLTDHCVMNVSLAGARFRLSGGNFARFHVKAKGVSRMEV